MAKVRDICHDQAQLPFAHAIPKVRQRVTDYLVQGRLQLGIVGVTQGWVGRLRSGVPCPQKRGAEN